jgi:uncharacterized protein with PIN domain
LKIDYKLYCFLEEVRMFTNGSEPSDFPQGRLLRMACELLLENDPIIKENFSKCDICGSKVETVHKDFPIPPCSSVQLEYKKCTECEHSWLPNTEETKITKATARNYLKELKKAKK